MQNMLHETSIKNIKRSNLRFGMYIEYIFEGLRKASGHCRHRSNSKLFRQKSWWRCLFLQVYKLIGGLGPATGSTLKSSLPKQFSK